MAKLRIVEINPEIRADVEANDGYCPCAIWQNPDTKCMCREFREQEEPGLCHCGRFEKVDAGNCEIAEIVENCDDCGFCDKT